MAVYLKKLQQGGAVSPKINVYGATVDLGDFTKAITQNFETFYNAYKGIWNKDQEQDALRQHNQLVSDLSNGLITNYSGPLQNLSGDYQQYADKVAQVVGIYGKQKEKKKFTNKSIMSDFYNEFFGGSAEPDFQSFLDLDEVTTDATGKKVRGVKNRINALLNFLNENYLSKYDDADESLGGMEGVRYKIDRLRSALADGKLDNEDYAAASALGFNLRGLLSGMEQNVQQQPNNNDLLEEIQLWESRDNGDFNLNFGSVAPIESSEFLQNYFKDDLQKYASHLSSLAKNLSDNGLNYYTPETLSTNKYAKNIPDGTFIQSMLDTMVNFRNILGIPTYQDISGLYCILPNSFDQNKGTILAYYPELKVLKPIKIWKSENKELLQSYYLRKHPELAQQVQKGQYGFKVQSDQPQYTNAEQAFIQKFNSSQLGGGQPEVQEQQNTSIMDQQKYLQSVPETWGKKEWAEIVSIASSLAAIADPEPFSAAALGLNGTLFHAYNLAKDKDGFSLGDVGNTLLNVGFDVAGAIPVLGDFAQAKKITKIIKSLGAPLLGIMGATQIPGAFESTSKLLKGGTDEMTVQDWRNIANGFMAVLGAKNYWTNKYRSRALDNAPDFVPQTSLQQAQYDFHNTLRSAGKSNGEPTGWWESFKKNLSPSRYYEQKFGATPKQDSESPSPIWETPDWVRNTGNWIKKTIGFKKSGGVLKMQPGGWFENYKKRYQQQALSGWDTTKDQSRAGQNLRGNGHYNAGSLQEAYNRNVAYIDDFDAVGKDLQDYYNSSYSNNSLEDYVNNYNSDIDRLTGHWSTNRTYGSTDARDHNRLFRSMYARRSSQDSNSPYNIGYQDDIEDIEGSSAWLRRADNYENLWDETSLEDKLRRIHKIKLGNGQEGFVYKENNGKIGIIGNNQVQNLINEYSKQNPEQPATVPSTSSGPYVEAPEPKDINRDNGLWERTVPSLIALQRLYGDIHSSNDRTKKYLNSLVTPSVTPPKFYRQVYGDYGLMKHYEDQGAQVNSMANRATTSNGKLAFLQRLEGQNKATELSNQGKLADNERIKKTGEIAAEQAKENVLSEVKAANENSALRAKMAQHKAETEAYTDATNRQSIDTYHQNYIEAPITQAINEHRAYQDIFDNLQLQQNLNYDFESDYEYQKLINDYQNALNSGDQEAADRAYNNALQYRKSKQQDKYNETLDYFRRMKRLRQRFPYTTVYRP